MVFTIVTTQYQVTAKLATQYPGAGHTAALYVG